ncbi:MAG TPA: alpha/beta family hydrolase, partial [Burkholderiaceae bacterium]|nr:alpha/beta family hydrolase [Burkholderiaceae bacterium]
MTTRPEPIRVPTEGHPTLSGLVLTPPRPAAAFVFAHGAGAGMEHPFMARLAEALCERTVATLRF